jgi:hypothetical protein
MYARAYEWEPVAHAMVRREQTTSMRSYIRRWITEWDLRRLNPEAEIDIETSEWRADYSEHGEADDAKEQAASDQSLIDDVLGDIA